MRKTFKLALASLWFATAVCATEAKADGFIGTSKLLGYDVGDSAKLIFHVEASTGCSSYIIYVNRSDAWYNDMLAIVISAWNTGKPINVYVAGCEANGYVHAVRMVQGGVF